MPHAPKPSVPRRRVRVLLRRIGVWLDAWCLRGYSQDTHCWPAKVERLRTMKRTSHQIR